MTKEIYKCKYCGKELVPLNPPVEEYVEYKILIKIPFTDWKIMLLRDDFEYGCPDCLAEEQNDKRQDDLEDAYKEGQEDGYNKATERND